MFDIVPKVYAATCNPGSPDFKLTDCYKLNDTKTVAEVYTDPSVLLNLVVRNLFVIAGVIFFFMIILAGFQFISGDTKGPDQAKNIFTAAVIGFIVMFSAYWIIQIIQILTGISILTPVTG